MNIIDVFGKDYSNETYNKYFGCDHKNLTSLKGAPKEVIGDFNCSYNELTSLKNVPRMVIGDFSCTHNNLTSLVDAPKKVNGYFWCQHNNIPIEEIVRYILTSKIKEKIYSDYNYEALNKMKDLFYKKRYKDVIKIIFEEL